MHVVGKGVKIESRRIHIGNSMIEPEVTTYMPEYLSLPDYDFIFRSTYRF